MKRGIYIENQITLKKQTAESLTYTNIIMFTVTSIFLPYVIAGITLVGLGIYLILNRQTRKIIFSEKYSKIVILFLLFYIIQALNFGNWFGVGAGTGLILAAAIGFFQRRYMTVERYERILTLICFLSVISSSCAISQKFIISLVDDLNNYDRISSMFLHPNYFGTITATVIIICAYKILSGTELKWLYYVIGIINIVSIYLSESMFAWVEIFTGIAVLLFIMKKYRTLAFLIGGGLAAGILIVVLNIGLIPRLCDAGETFRLRLDIWSFAIKEIRKAPLIGHSFMSCAFLSWKDGNLIPHAHSIYLEMLMDLGFIGTFFFTVYVFKYIVKVIKLCFVKKKTKITALILAVTAAGLVHGLADLTLFWIQTMPLYIFILTGIGAFEKHEDRVEVNLLFRQRYIRKPLPGYSGYSSRIKM